MELYLGLISGTSADGVDAALVDFESGKTRIVGTYFQPFTQDLREKIFSLTIDGESEIQKLGQLDIELGKIFADTALHLLEKEAIDAMNVKAIGSHGQTIRHSPPQFTLQIADPNMIAELTGITTVADFRRRDIALGGQGAPLVPAFHHYAFFDEQISRAIINIGGIANVTFLTTSDIVTGFDTGPGNGLLDAWISKIKNVPFDEQGNWAAQGKISQPLLKLFLEDPYFRLDPPKSSGREYFNLSWLQEKLKIFGHDIHPTDVQATLVELTVQTILNAIKNKTSSCEIIMCGGGVKNNFLMSRLQILAAPIQISTTNHFGIDPDWVEAIAFAWLAKQTLNKRNGNIPSVTGAKKAVILGGVYFAT